MRQLFLVMIGLVWLAQPATAQTFSGCDTEQSKIIADALGTAKELTLKAAVAVGDTSDYQRWFGDYTQANAEEVRANLKAVVRALRGGGVTAQCEVVGDDGCSAGEYAWVFAHEPYLMHLCPSFFSLPALVALQPGSRRSDNGTREGTIVHEVSHFIHVADTDDHCYSRRECAQMALSDPRRAIENADSYQYFTEDVTYYARQPLGNKPPPAPRSSR
ncbi:MAG: M35 family metallo-endopeptidase [Yoonia sp.]|uniref:M35 family metallo-endopeptidase n=1 Tax=Yoonia sp. TaxID=2212373 RepID=UPI00273DF10C|nr:M35 family metallo-endopeptidase [Yoonia sp.]MDP5084311.1 M35 family metallo-endopeptidase [Yoonia sp.]MDP5361708.1 M35 family metallo-endopeptidase [Paracoccaceae bacterium]